MPLADVDHEHVLKAIDEFDELGQDAFLSKYGFGQSRQFVLFYKDRQYDSKAIVGAAHRHAAGYPLAAKDFSGGVKTVGARLVRLGFDFRDLALMPTRAEEARYGNLSGFPEGSTFKDRAEVAASGVHRALQAGIVGTKRLGAESIVSSGGYEDDIDGGNELTYTGHGGREGGRQIADQSFDAPGNAALRASCLTGQPVRVVRGADPKDPNFPGPKTGYRYDGLFRVERAEMARGRSGFQICRFEMVKLSDAVDVTFEPGSYEIPSGMQHPEAPLGNLQPERRLARAQRIVRSTKVVEYVKKIYDHTCQICGVRLSTRNGEGYSEGAHIQALGGLNRGPDVPQNVLCLCPNCHVQFDFGAIVVQQDRTVLRDGRPAGMLAEHELHSVGDEFLAHHRAKFL